MSEKNGCDLTLAAGDLGYLNIRVGAIILKDGKFLMAGNNKMDYLYSVGGRVQFGETTEQAVIREVFEETGTMMEIDRLGFVSESFFISDVGKTTGKKIYEIDFYYYMKVPADFQPVCKSSAVDGSEEFVTWVDPSTEKTIFPEFFKTELLHPQPYVKHLIYE